MDKAQLIESLAVLADGVFAEYNELQNYGLPLAIHVLRGLCDDVEIIKEALLASMYGKAESLNLHSLLGN